MKSKAIAVVLMAVALVALSSSNANAEAFNARWCANAITAVANHCPPQNPTPPGGNTCLACAVALKNCDKACGAGTCTADPTWYPPEGSTNSGEICPKPYPSYGGGIVTINGDILQTVK